MKTGGMDFRFMLCYAMLLQNFNQFSFGTQSFKKKKKKLSGL